MEREGKQKNPSPLPTTTTTATSIIKEESPRKLPISGGLVGGTGGGGDNNASGSGGNERLKRDEWSEGAVSSLLEAYESKWVLRNRAKLKGHDWEDVARHVSARANSTKSPKTQTQCKNKIESMKKRYRSESATPDHASTWPLYSRLDLLLRGSGPPMTTAAAAAPPPPTTLLPPPPPPPPPLPLQLQPQLHEPTLPPFTSPPLMLLEPSQVMVVQPPLPLPNPPPVAVTAQNSHGSGGFDRAKEGCEATKLSENARDTDSSSTPALYSDNNERQKKQKKQKAKMAKNKKRKKNEELGIGESIKRLAEVVVRSEQARMEAMREIEKMRMECEAKRSEMDLKRTEIIANTQLEIAKLFAGGGGGGKSGGGGGGGAFDSSLRIGRN